MSERMPDLSFYTDVIHALEDIQAPYMIIGAFAAAIYGNTRVTFDIDIVVDLQETHINALAKRYPSPRYYADPEQMRDSIRWGIIFNIIDSERGQKVDLIPITMEPYYREAFRRRIQQFFEDTNGRQSEAWFARPEDVIIGKLMAWVEGKSSRHEQDIFNMLCFTYAGLDSSLSYFFDEKYIDSRVEGMDTDVHNLWNSLKKAAMEKIED